MHLFWYGVIALLWAGFFALEGFGLGVGTLLPVVGRTDAHRREIVRSIAPAWDGNEAWLLGAGAATFFAFRGWFDGLLSGFSIIFLSIIGGLILRVFALNRGRKTTSLGGRRFCDAIVFVGSIGPAFLLGLLFANFLRGVDLGASGVVRGSFSDDLSAYALLGGTVAVLLFVFQGAAFLSMRTIGKPHVMARRAMYVIAPIMTAATIAFLTWSEIIRGGVLSRVVAGVITIGVLAALIRAGLGHPFRAFTDAAVTTLLVPLWVFSALWPDVLPSRNASVPSLTVHSAAATSGALIVLTIVGIELAAVVLVYLTWSYWIFHARLTGKIIVDEPIVRPTRLIPTPNGQPKPWALADARLSPTVASALPELGRQPSTSEA